MKNAKRVITLVSILLLSLGLSTSCLLIGDNYKIRDLISYIDQNKEGDQKYNGAHIYDEHVQKSISIDFTKVDTVKDADEIIRLINQFLDNQPEYFLHENYYITVTMRKMKTTYSQTFSCRNSMEFFGVGDDKYQDVTVTIEDNLSYLIVSGITMSNEELKISLFSGLFSDIKKLDLCDKVSVDDLNVFGTFKSLETVWFENSDGHISDDIGSQLEEMYPEIEFQY